jgi:hypothetical protein
MIVTIPQRASILMEHEAFLFSPTTLNYSNLGDAKDQILACIEGLVQSNNGAKISVKPRYHGIDVTVILNRELKECKVIDSMGHIIKLEEKDMAILFNQLIYNVSWSGTTFSSNVLEPVEKHVIEGTITVPSMMNTLDPVSQSIHYRYNNVKDSDKFILYALGEANLYSVKDLRDIELLPKNKRDNYYNTHNRNVLNFIKYKTTESKYIKRKAIKRWEENKKLDTFPNKCFIPTKYLYSSTIKNKILFSPESRNSFDQIIEKFQPEKIIDITEGNKSIENSVFEILYSCNEFVEKFYPPISRLHITPKSEGKYSGIDIILNGYSHFYKKLYTNGDNDSSIVRSYTNIYLNCLKSRNAIISQLLSMSSNFREHSMSIINKHLQDLIHNSEELNNFFVRPIIQ